MFFKASEIEDTKDDIQDIPPGSYECLVERAEMKESRNTPGNTYISVMARVRDGEPQGNRCIFDKFFFKGSYQEDTLMKSKRRLKRLTNACGMEDLEKLQDLIDKKVLVTVKYWKNKNNETNQDVIYDKSKSDQDVPF